MKEIPGGVCAPKGFSAGGVWCGVKASSRKRDLALLLADRPCAAAGLFTGNRVKAASVLVTREHLEGGLLQAVIANSGNANACTGEAGLEAARRMARAAARECGVREEQVAVASTGVIGVPLPVETIEEGVKTLAGTLTADQAGHDAALEAIMTTDTRKKGWSVEIELGGRTVRIGAMTKGSGMIHPNLGTMLCFITTDAAIARAPLEAALGQAARRSFNRLTVDGDTSTNDTLLIMASGLAGNAPIQDAAGEDYRRFQEALTEVCVYLTREMARDGEGATKLITVKVKGAAGEDDAARLARTVAASSLVKAACFGADANWGRVLCAMGYSGVPFDPEAVSVTFASAAGVIPVFKEGRPLHFDEAVAKLILSQPEIGIDVSAGEGPGEAAAWGCDLSYDYVKINGDYRS